MNNHALIYQCPVCLLGLEQHERHYQCANRHSFDLAKEGYVNLLLAQHKKSHDPGDNKEMIRSRRKFLEKGFYDILPVKLAELIRPIVMAGDCRLLDAGCGEGYYIGFIQRAVGQNLTCWGVDISKPGISYAARRYKGINFSVASSFRLPIFSESVDIVTRIYAPGDAMEFARVLKPAGVLITVIPGPNHLYGLKQHLYQEPARHEGNETLPEGFVRMAQERVQGQLLLASSVDINNLLAMTPYYWHMPKAVQEKVSGLNSLATEIDFMIQLYKKI